MPTPLVEPPPAKRSQLSPTSTPPRGKRIDDKQTPTRHREVVPNTIAPRSISPLFSFFPAHKRVQGIYAKCLECYDKLVMAKSQFEGHIIGPLCLYIDGIDDDCSHEILDEVLGCFGESILSRCVLTNHSDVKKLQDLAPGFDLLILTKRSLQSRYCIDSNELPPIMSSIEVENKGAYNALLELLDRDTSNLTDDLNEM